MIIKKFHQYVVWDMLWTSQVPNSKYIFTQYKGRKSDTKWIKYTNIQTHWSQYFGSLLGRTKNYINQMTLNDCTNPHQPSCKPKTNPIWWWHCSDQDLSSHRISWPETEAILFTDTYNTANIGRVRTQNTVTTNHTHTHNNSQSIEVHYKFSIKSVAIIITI